MKLTRLATLVLSVAVLAMTASDVLAQRGGQGGRGGGPQGGRGGMMQGGMRGGPGGPGGMTGGGTQGMMMLLFMPEVQKELDLFPEQLDGLREAGQKLRDEGREMMEKSRGSMPGNFRDMSEEERRSFMEEQRKKMEPLREELDKKTMDMLSQVLMPDQIARLKGLFIQREGVSAITVKHIGDDLGVTAAQKEELRKAQEEARDSMREKMGQLFAQMRDGGGSREDMQKKMEELREESNAKLLDVLTDEQKKKFEDMKGDSFEFPERQGFGGRGGPGGQPGAGRGGQGGQGGRGPGGRGGQGVGRSRPQ